MIVFEGPDGAGKTTALTKLAEILDLPIHERASTSLGGPVDNIWDWAYGDVSTWMFQGLSIYDRHPMISEPIYAPVRGVVPDMRFLNSEGGSLLGRMYDLGLVVWCMPPIETVYDNVAFETDQMDGVVANISKIYDQYRQVREMHAHMYRQPYFFVYDYTKGEEELEQLFHVAQAHKIKWERKWGRA